MQKRKTRNTTTRTQSVTTASTNDMHKSPVQTIRSRINDLRSSYTRTLQTLRPALDELANRTIHILETNPNDIDAILMREMEKNMLAKRTMLKTRMRLKRECMRREYQGRKVEIETRYRDTVEDCRLKWLNGIYEEEEWEDQRESDEGRRVTRSMTSTTTISRSAPSHVQNENENDIQDRIPPLTKSRQNYVRGLQGMKWSIQEKTGAAAYGSHALRERKDRLDMIRAGRIKRQDTKAKHKAKTRRRR